MDDATNTQRRGRAKHALAMIAASIFLAGGAYAVGFWNRQSSLYWREVVQARLLALGGMLTNTSAGADYAAVLARLALSAHISRVSDAELAQAAQLLERARLPEDASALWLGLANRQSAANRDAAATSASRAYANEPSTRALESLIVLSPRATDDRKRWITELQRAEPHHELARAFRCLNQLKSFEHSLPRPCASSQVTWVRDGALFGKREDRRIDQHLAKLPEKSATEIQVLKSKLRERYAADTRYRSEIDQYRKKRDSVWLEALLLTGIKLLLPIPEPGESIEQWFARANICRIPLIRWLCGGETIKKQIDKAKEQIAPIDELIALTEKSVEINGRSIEYTRDQIAYWSGSGLTDALKNERSLLLYNFTNAFEDEIQRRYPEVGRPSEACIRQVTRSRPPSSGQGRLLLALMRLVRE